MIAELATETARARVVETVSAAFAKDPAFAYFFDNDPACAAVFAGYLFDRRVGSGGVWTVNGGDAVSMWDKPSGGRKLTLELPADVLARIDTFDHAVHPLLPTEPHWYLGVLATHPAHAGKQWGRLAMAAGLAEAQQAGLPAYLETATESNVDLYRRAGWELVGQPTDSPIPVWIMRLTPCGAPARTLSSDSIN